MLLVVLEASEMVPASEESTYQVTVKLTFEVDALNEEEAITKALLELESGVGLVPRSEDIEVVRVGI